MPEQSDKRLANCQGHPPHKSNTEIGEFGLLEARLAQHTCVPEAWAWAGRLAERHTGRGFGMKDLLKDAPDMGLA